MRRALMVAAILAACIAGRSALAQGLGTLQTVAVVGGQPDDITIDGQGRLIWGDLAHGTVDRLDKGGRIVTLARGLSVPEGVVALPHGTIVVAEQGRDRIVQINRRGKRRVLLPLQPVPGQEGVDGIGRDPRTGDFLIPDSPRGTVLRLSANGHASHTIAQGLGRPVDAAVDTRGDVLAPDEHLGTVVVISPKGQISHLGTLATPDDVAVDRSGRIWITTLGDNSLWLVTPGGTPQRVLSGLANPQGLTLDRCGNPIVVEQSVGRIVRYVASRSSPSGGCIAS